MAQHTPYLLTGSGDGPYEIQQGNRAVALLRNTTFEVATRITRCLNACSAIAGAQQSNVDQYDKHQAPRFVKIAKDALV